MVDQVTFRELIDTARSRGRAQHVRPRSMAWVAESCDLSLAHIYNLIHGRKGAPTWTIAKIARGLKVSRRSVAAAVELSRDLGGVI